MTSHAAGESSSDPLAAFEALALPELEEAAGEIERRMGVALRRIGEHRADEPDIEGVSPRRRVAALTAGSERLAFALGALIAGVTAGDEAVARHPALVAAVSYAAPSIGALLSRLDQDRRLLTSLGRQLESRLGVAVPQLEGRTPRRALIEALLVDPARCAQLLEREAERREA